MLYNHSATLLTVSSPTTQDRVGEPCKIAPRFDEQGFKLQYSITQTNTQSSTYQDPNQTVLYVETSADALTWLDAITPEIVASNTTVAKLVDCAAILTYVRARTQVSGPDKPSHTASVTLVSNRGFTVSV